MAEDLWIADKRSRLAYYQQMVEWLNKRMAAHGGGHAAKPDPRVDYLTTMVTIMRAAAEETRLDHDYEVTLVSADADLHIPVLSADSQQ